MITHEVIARNGAYLGNICFIGNKGYRLNCQVGSKTLSRFSTPIGVTRPNPDDCIPPLMQQITGCRLVQIQYEDAANKGGE